MNVLQEGPVRRAVCVIGTVALGSALVFTAGLQASFAADPVPPAPPSTGTDVPLTYFGPPPSESFTPGNDQLVGPQQLLKSGTIDPRDRSITLPLYLGHTKGGKNVWFILTDTNDERNANALGLNHSAKLAYAGVEGGTRTATLNGSGRRPCGRGRFCAKVAKCCGDRPRRVCLRPCPA